MDESLFKKKSSTKKITTRKKNMTFLDLKVKNIENIIRKTGKSYGEDFIDLVDKDEKKITKCGWKSFYNALSKES